MASIPDKVTMAVEGEIFDPVRDIEEFHKKFGLEYVEGPRLLPRELAKFRADFMYEELDEYYDVMPTHDEVTAMSEKAHTFKKEKSFDALIDLVYVALGTAYLHGFDFREGWRRVHEANMAKVRVDSETLEGSVRKSKFDVIKPPGWKPPVLTDLVEHRKLTSDNA